MLSRAKIIIKICFYLILYINFKYFLPMNVLFVKTLLTFTLF
jgi:hypothetical protein